MGVTAEHHGASFWGAEKVLKLTVVMACITLWLYKDPCVVLRRWGNGVLCELELSKAANDRKGGETKGIIPRKMGRTQQRLHPLLGVEVGGPFPGRLF